MNPHQQQLLQLLQIKPLQLHAGFENYQPIDLPTPAVAQPDMSDLEISQREHQPSAVSHPPEFSSLLADIERAIQEYLPQLTWRYDAGLTHAALVATEIQIPDLSNLTSKASKQQLWQVISTQSATKRQGTDE